MTGDVTRKVPSGVTDGPNDNVSIRAQAKLNLWLHVLAREASGYHSIETLFHRIDLADQVTVTLARPGDRSVRCSEDVGPETDNLAYRAACMFTEQTAWATGFDIAIEKRIPCGGGLGGGSADAAATLLALNSMCPLPVADSALAGIARRLGADVPFLVAGAPCALAWGRGDRLLTLPALPQRHVALVVPGFGVSTAEAYASVPERAAALPQFSERSLTDWAAIAKYASNDLSHSSVARRHEVLGNAVAELRAAGALLAEMTGSGSVIFGIFDDEPDVASLERATGCRVLVTRTAVAVDRVAAAGSSA